MPTIQQLVRKGRQSKMAKAKTRAEEERHIYRDMLEQVHDRSLRERLELRKEAQIKLEAAAERGRARKQRILVLERELKARSQVEEEKNAYKEQCMALMEQCSSLMDQLRQASGVAPEMPPVQAPPPPPPPNARGGGASRRSDRDVGSPAGGGLMGLMQGARASLRSSISTVGGPPPEDERPRRGPAA